ncbi:MAG: molybdenum cofactor guanylyltransferase [Firmicutes bacterium]|nr:molybdenum cofactor guanylyltransferase [Bacillota bacterium]
MLSLDGVVLAGGASRRMGQPKSSLPWSPTMTLLDHAVAILREATQGTIWISQRVPSQETAPTEILDRHRDRGPLAGIEAVFHYTKSPLVLVLAVDLPAIPGRWYEDAYRLWLANPSLDVVYAASASGRAQPLAALWHCRTQPLLDQWLRGPAAPRVMAVLHQLRAQAVVLPDSALINLNTPEDWRRMSRQTSV